MRWRVIRLEKITANNFRGVINLRVSDQQKDFIDTPEYSLAQAYVFGEDRQPYAVMNDKNTVVGFIMFVYDNNLRHTEIANLIVDNRLQGKGYGTQILKEAISFLTLEKRTDVVHLDYDPENIVAKNLYEKFGFVSLEIDNYGEMLMEKKL